jgi:hypothetical protein
MRPPSPDRRLIVSIHDVSPAFAESVERLAEMIGGILDGPRFAMLVVPDHWGAAPLDRTPAFARRLREWADAGVEMFLHGWFHRDTSAHRGAAAAMKARYMTAGEGEFLGLSADEAEYRMRAGLALRSGREVGAEGVRFRARGGSFPGLAAGERRGRRAGSGRHLGKPLPCAHRQFARGRRRRAHAPGLAPDAAGGRAPRRRHEGVADDQYRSDHSVSGGPPHGRPLRRSIAGRSYVGRGGPS